MKLQKSKRILKKINASKVYDVTSFTPLSSARLLSKKFKNNILLKREDMQPVFSFKLRGAYNKISILKEKGSNYRVDGIELSMGIPPTVAFTVRREGDATDVALGLDKK